MPNRPAFSNSLLKQNKNKTIHFTLCWTKLSNYLDEHAKFTVTLKLSHHNFDLQTSVMMDWKAQAWRPSPRRHLWPVFYAMTIKKHFPRKSPSTFISLSLTLSETFWHFWRTKNLPTNVSCVTFNPQLTFIKDSSLINFWCILAATICCRCNCTRRPLKTCPSRRSHRRLVRPHNVSCVVWPSLVPTCFHVIWHWCIFISFWNLSCLQHHLFLVLFQFVELSKIQRYEINGFYFRFYCPTSDQTFRRYIDGSRAVVV